MTYTQQFSNTSYTHGSGLVYLADSMAVPDMAQYYELSPSPSVHQHHPEMHNEDLSVEEDPADGFAPEEPFGECIDGHGLILPNAASEKKHSAELTIIVSELTSDIDTGAHRPSNDSTICPPPGIYLRKSKVMLLGLFIGICCFLVLHGC